MLLARFGMFVADRQRLLFWSSCASGPLYGGSATGVLGQPNANPWEEEDVTHGGTSPRSRSTARATCFTRRSIPSWPPGARRADWSRRRRRPSRSRAPCRLGNLHVVDGTWEAQGNQRALEFDRSVLPPIPSPQLFWATGGPSATRVYAKNSFTDVACDPDFTNQPCTPTSVSFEPGTNRMVQTVGACGTNCPTNPLYSRVFYYENPVPAGVTAPTPNGHIPLPFGQASSSSWDSSHRLAILDTPGTSWC